MQNRGSSELFGSTAREATGSYGTRTHAKIRFEPVLFQNKAIARSDTTRLDSIDCLRNDGERFSVPEEKDATRTATITDWFRAHGLVHTLYLPSVSFQTNPRSLVSF